MNREGWRISLVIAGGQCLITLLLAGALLATTDGRNAWSALLGGGIGTVANLAMGAYMFTVDHATPQATLRGFYIGEVLKIALTGVLFFLALVYVNVAPAILLVAFIAALLCQWMLPLAFDAWREGAGP